MDAKEYNEIMERLDFIEFRQIGRASCRERV